MNLLLIPILFKIRLENGKGNKMARLLLNYDALRNSCVKNLNEAIAKLDSAVSIFNSLSIPYDYRKRQNIINIKNSIIKRRKELVDIRNWIMNSKIMPVYWFFIPLFAVYLSMPVLGRIEDRYKKEV